MNHHHAPADAVTNVTYFHDLQRQFGTESGADDEAGEVNAPVLDEMAQIVEYQWRRPELRGLVKGFLLSGPPGVGKTTVARRLAYELAIRFGAQQDPDAVSLMFVDGSEIARARYGESEERIRQIFRSAESADTGDEPRRTVLLFDDVESILMARGSQHAKEWHFSQDSVFFHAVDDLDSSKTVLVLTTNRSDLVDDAIRDRFLQYQFGSPSREAMTQVAISNARAHGFDDHDLDLVRERVSEGARSGSLTSLRDVERLVLQVHVERALGRPSLASRT